MSWSAVGAVFATLTAITTLLDLMLSREEIDRQRAGLIKWWLRLDAFSVAQAIRQTSIFFNENFDRIYGSRALSWRRFRGSVLTTLAIVFTLWLFLLFPKNGFQDFADWDGGRPQANVIPFIVESGEASAEASVGSAEAGVEGSAMSAAPNVTPLKVVGSSWLVLYVLMTNLVSDYIALNKTRILLRWSEAAQPWLLAILVPVDLISTTLIYLICGLMLFAPPWNLSALADAQGYLVMTIFYSSAVIGGSGKVTFLRVFFIAAFGGTLMYFVFLGTTLLVRALGLIRTRVMNVIEKLEASNHLFKAVGALLGAFVALVKGIAEFVAAVTA